MKLVKLSVLKCENSSKSSILIFGAIIEHGEYKKIEQATWKKTR